MLFDHPAGANVIDNETIVGKPESRIEGPLKVSGRARYAYERQDVGADPVYGYVVAAGVAKGAISAIDLSAARATSGFLGAVTTRTPARSRRASTTIADLLAGPNVAHYHQAIAVVVCETFEQAREAARQGARVLRQERRRVRSQAGLRGQQRQADEGGGQARRQQCRRVRRRLRRRAGQARRDLYHA